MLSGKTNYFFIFLNFKYEQEFFDWFSVEMILFEELKVKNKTERYFIFSPFHMSFKRDSRI